MLLKTAPDSHRKRCYRGDETTECVCPASYSIVLKLKTQSNRRGAQHIVALKLRPAFVVRVEMN